jgi:hypothetical protein
MARLTFGVTSAGLAVPVWVGITDPAQPAGSPWLTCSDMLVTELATLLPDTDILIGLDVVLTCKLVVDGPGRSFTLEF